eukprot:m.170109 g.170109  ORF g.170109 m.170109 type:complete len:157 (-) comp25138_c0_seq6:115-585(-)
MFPTLVELATGQAVPQCDPSALKSRETSLCREGFSLVPLLKNNATQWTRAAFSQYMRENEKIMGYTIRVNNFRYTEWVSFDSANATADFSSKPAGRELYVHDPAVPNSWDMEGYNVVDDFKYSALVEQMHNVLVKCHARPDLCSNDDFQSVWMAKP